MNMGKKTLKNTKMGVKQKRLKEIQSAHFKNGFQNKSQKFLEEHRDIFKSKNKNVIFFCEKVITSLQCNLNFIQLLWKQVLTTFQCN